MNTGTGDVCGAIAKPIAALFVQTNGTYYNLPGVDPWDEQRDARTYQGNEPAVLHPPCARWCKYARINLVRYGIPIGADNGCFESAVNTLLRVGGVLEHPAQSIAFDRFGIGRPPAGRWEPCGLGGHITQVYQGRYGHLAPKPTWLWAVGTALPALDHRRIRTGIQCTPVKGCYYLSSKQRSATPAQFRDLLICMARSVY